MPDRRLERHDLVQLVPGAPDPLPSGVPGAARTAWAAAGRPLIVRRGARQAGLPLGLPLPPGMGKARIALYLRPEDAAPRPAPGPEALRAAAPPDWRGTLEAAHRVAAAHGVRVGAFGALLWQALTGLDYLHPGSDLDLLWRCPGAVPPGLPSAIAALAEEAPMRIDGEIVVGGWGVQWRELAMAGPSDPVLCRGTAGAEMRPAMTFVAPRAA